MEKKYVAKIDMVRYEKHTKLAESVYLEPIEFMAYLAARIESTRLERKMAERATAEGEC